ncbi:MAG: hypothetical protein KZQ58_08940, partial [gamma proteobacterium symbiont of Bathyaustriella thionipta]|nr:hypothetical protein [gamma proteobacterium symbiont of Bathyaustriella thionipta]
FFRAGTCQTNGYHLYFPKNKSITQAHACRKPGIVLETEKKESPSPLQNQKSQNFNEKRSRRFYRLIRLMHETPGHNTNLIGLMEGTPQPLTSASWALPCKTAEPRGHIGFALFRLIMKPSEGGKSQDPNTCTNI